MRRMLIILFAYVLVSVSATGFAATERRVALVIGNSAYKNAPLRNPVNDATDVGIALKRLGFQVTVLRDASQRKMEDSIRAFGKQLTKGGVGLFYYAGHGMQVNGRNYLIPVDARIEDPSDVKYEAIDAGRVLGKMEVAGNDINIVILDACRDNPFSRSWRSSQKGLARMDAPKGSYIAYATAPGSVAADGSGRNGTFTKSLLRHIEVPGLPIEVAIKRVRKDVVKETGSKQIPWSSSSLIGDFSFVPNRGITVTKKKPVQESPIVASVSPKISSPQIVERDGSFEKLSSGIVFDSKTNLEWYAGPDQDTNWYEAQKWIKNLEIDGGGWRTPKMRELESLYFENPEMIKLTTLFKTSGDRVWSTRTHDISAHSAFSFYFKGAGARDRRVSSSSLKMRAFAVRTRK